MTYSHCVKRCTKCDQIKALSAGFNRNRSRRDGREARCRVCLYAKRRKSYEANREKYAAKAKQYRQENQEAISKKRKARYQENRDQILEKRRQYYSENAEEIKARQRKYNAENKDKIRAYESTPEYKAKDVLVSARRRAQKNGVTATLTGKEWDQVLEHFHHECVYCEAPWEHQDHFKPLSRGGTHSMDNVVPACSACNLSKNAADPFAWYLQKTGTLLTQVPIGYMAKA
mgnify:CR=1 FL=1